MSWVLVTGGTARGGEAIVRTLHGAGLNVVIHHSPRSSDRAASLCAELDERRGGSTRTWEVDLSQSVKVPSWLNELAPEYCVCNASVYQPSSLGDGERQAADIAVHLSAHAAILQALGLGLRSVVAVTDIHVDRPATGYLWYTVAKAALQSLMLTLAMEWAPRVRCNVVAPGTLPLPQAWTDEGRTEAIKQSIPLGQLGRFEDLASAVKWMLLDAQYVTGQVLAIDGGRSRSLRN
jgi:pteridine reductase